MTAGNNVILSAIQVDIARHPGQTLPSSMGHFIRRRNRGATKRCLFGSPDPGVTRTMLNKIIARDNAYMRQRYNFDVQSERFIEPEGIVEATGGETTAVSEATTTTTIASTAADDTSVNCDINLQRPLIERDVPSELETTATLTISSESTSATASNSDGLSLNLDLQSADATTICRTYAAAVILDDNKVPLLKDDTCANPSDAKRSRSSKYNSEIVYVDHKIQLVGGGDGHANKPYQKTITGNFSNKALIVQVELIFLHNRYIFKL